MDETSFSLLARLRRSNQAEYADRRACFEHNANVDQSLFQLAVLSHDYLTVDLPDGLCALERAVPV
jgi:hypothetical protein